MPTWTGFAANGGSDFSERQHSPRLADNHAAEMTTEGIKKGFGKVVAALDKQESQKSFVDIFKESRYFISPKKS
jgi:hypothetical protein